MMASSQQENSTLTASVSYSTSSAQFNISPSRYLRVPAPKISKRPSSRPKLHTWNQRNSKLDCSFNDNSLLASVPRIPFSSRVRTPGCSSVSQPPTWPVSLSNRLYLSVYSSSSNDTEQSDYSNPPARQYCVPNFPKMTSSRKITAASLLKQATKHQGVV